jgi:hypothetical protein
MGRVCQLFQCFIFESKSIKGIIMEFSQEALDSMSVEDLQVLAHQVRMALINKQFTEGE